MFSLGLDVIAGDLPVHPNHYNEDLDDMDSGKMSPQPSHKSSKGESFDGLDIQKLYRFCSFPTTSKLRKAGSVDVKQI